LEATLTSGWRSLAASRNWRRLYFAYAISSFGDGFTQIALLAKVYQLGGQVSGLALVAIAQAAPSLFVAPLAGALAERGNKRLLLVAADVARSALLLIIYFSRSLAAIMWLAMLLALFTAVFEPVEAALEPELLPAPRIVAANAVRTGTRNVLRIASPAAIALVLARFGAGPAFLFDAATFAASAVLLIGLPAGASISHEAFRIPTGSVWEGLLWVARRSDLRALLAAHCIIVLLMGMQGPVLYGFVAHQLGRGGDAYALLMTAMGAGSVAGSAFLYRLSTSSAGRIRAMMGVLLVDAAALFGFSFGRTLLQCLGFTIVLGLISAAFHILVRSYLQTMTDPEYRARTLSLLTAVYGPFSILSLALVIPVSNLASPGGILRGAALCEAAAAALVLLLWRS
jgi:hypothetical protein